MLNIYWLSISHLVSRSISINWHRRPLSLWSTFSRSPPTIQVINLSLSFLLFHWPLIFGIPYQAFCSSSTPEVTSSPKELTQWVVAWTSWALETMRMPMTPTLSFLLLWPHQLSIDLHLNYKNDIYTCISSRSYPRSMFQTEPLISMPPSHGFYIVSHFHCFSYCSGSIRMSHPWGLSFSKSLPPNQPHVLTALPSKYVLNLTVVTTVTLFQAITSLHSGYRDCLLTCVPGTFSFSNIDYQHSVIQNIKIRLRNSLLPKPLRTSHFTQNTLWTFPHILKSPI